MVLMFYSVTEILVVDRDKGAGHASSGLPADAQNVQRRVHRAKKDFSARCTGQTSGHLIF